MKFLSYKYLFSIFVVFSFIFLFSLPYLLTNIFLKLPHIRDQIHSYVDKHFMGVAYNGIRFDPYKGLILHEMRIALSPNIRKDNIIFQANKLYISVSIKELLFEGKINVAKLYAKHANIFINLNQRNLYNNLQKQVISWYKDHPATKFQFDNSTIHIDYEGQHYAEKEYHIHNASGDLSIKDSKVQLHIRYKDTIYGQGSLVFYPNWCTSNETFGQKNCFWFNGNYTIDVEQVSLNALHFLKPYYYFSHGTANIISDIEVSRNGSSYNILSEGDILYENMTLKKENQLLFRTKNSILQFSFKQNTKKIELSLSGRLDDYHGTFNIEKNLSSNTNFFDLVNLEIMAKSNQNGMLYLPYGLHITGLNSFKLKLAEEPGKRISINLACELSINQGTIGFDDSITNVYLWRKYMFSDKLLFVKQGRLYCEDNKLIGNFDFLHNKNDLSLDINADLHIENKLIDYLQYLPKNKTRVFIAENFPVVYSKFNVQASSKHLDWKTVEKYTLAIHKYFDKKIEYQLKHPFAQIPFGRYKWYQTFVANMDFDGQYSVYKYHRKEKKEPISISADFWLKKSSINLDISSANDVLFSMEWVLRYPLPFLQFDFNVDMGSQQNSLFSFVFGKNGITNFSSLELQGRFKAYGHTLMDIYKTRRSSGEAEFINISFEKSITNKMLQDADKLKLSFVNPSNNKRTVLSNIVVERGNEQFVGSGYVRDDIPHVKLY